MDTLNGQPNATSVLIAPKSFQEFTPEEYHEYVRAMYAVRRGTTNRPKPLAEGLTVSRTKSGKLSIRRQHSRPFAYVLRSEIEALSAGLGLSSVELWNLFSDKGYVITATRMEAERRYAEAKGIPF